MDNETLLTLLIVVAIVGGIAAAWVALRADRQSREELTDYGLAAASEGMTRCRQCGMGNLATDESCVACGASLPHSSLGGTARIR